jgi:hypothetical protein
LQMSEHSLICNDYWDAGYGRILMVPRVKLAYDHVRTARGSSVTREADAAGSACSTSSTPTGGT